MATTKYLSYEGLQSYDLAIKKYEAEKLGISITKAATANTTPGSSATYIVKQDIEYVLNSDPTQKLTRSQFLDAKTAFKADTTGTVVDPATIYTAQAKEVGKIEIPKDVYVESGAVDTRAKSYKVIDSPADASLTPGDVITVAAYNALGTAAQADYAAVNGTFIDLTLANKFEVDGITPVKVSVDISSVSGDISELSKAVTKLNADVNTVGSVLNSIRENALNATYTKNVDGSVKETIKDALERFEADLTYKGVATAQPATPAKGDLYNFNIAATDPDEVPASGDETAEVKGWKFWDGTAWQSLDDPTLAARVSALETQVGKDKAVTAYKTKTDLVDIVNVLTGADTVDGSILKAIKDQAGSATSDVQVVDKYEETANPGTFKTVAEYEALSATDQALYTAVMKDLTINEAIKDAKNAATAGSVVTVEKQATAETGYAASYVVKQNGTQVGVKINIPKDYLVKSGTLETCATDDTPVTGLKVGDKYLDFVVNTVDASETAQHIYLPVNDLFDSYTSGSLATDSIVVTVDNTTNKITAAITDATIARKKVDADFEKDLKAIEDAIGYVDPTAATKVLQSVSDTIEKEAKDAAYTTKKVYEEIANTSNVIDATAYAALSTADQALYAEKTVADKTIAQAIKALEDASSDTNGAFVFKGSVADISALPVVTAKKGDAYLTNDTNTLYIATTSADAATTTNATFSAIAVNGTFTVGNGALNKAVDVKTYIDSRIFVGSQADADAALLAGTIDDSTFTVIIDEDADGLAPITTTEINRLFD